MASITLKGVPDDLLEALRARARAERRSLIQEVLVLLEQALSEPPVHSAAGPGRGSQLAAWARLAGRWQPEGSIAGLAEEIYVARTPGREVAL
ncbi:MAG: Arc family DNA-binding protein [Deltaproteobacteria bacterium]|nr:Arc family DNA-binding protein [Deltaproteobacteria bacterium]